MKGNANAYHQKKWLTTILILTAVLVFIFCFTDINLYGLVCIANHNYDTPNEAMLGMFEADAADMGIDANTAVYTWKADESNAICCFLTENGIVMERMFLKKGKYHATGWLEGCEYGKDSMIDGELRFHTVKRIKPSGLYSGELQYALFCGDDKPPAGTIVYSFPANGKSYSIVVP